MATEILRPNAAGDLTGISGQNPSDGAHWEKVDDTGSGDDNSTYVVESDGGIKADLYSLPAPSGVGPINKITVYARIKGASTGGVPVPVFQIRMKTGGSEYDSGNIYPTASWVLYSYQWTLNPKSGIAWTWEDINLLQIGIGLGGWWYHPKQTATFCTQLYVEVDYIPYFDIGLRIQKGSQQIKVGVQAVDSSHQMRIYKNGLVYGIPLLDTANAKAGPIRIYDGNSVKAFPKVD